MNAIKTTAIVESSKSLRLVKALKDIEKGSEIELLILAKSQTKRDWQKILSQIGTYSDYDLEGFKNVREDFNKWQPKEY
jgi:hypothetical protein